jgi:hypothetical protein
MADIDQNPEIVLFDGSAGHYNALANETTWGTNFYESFSGADRPGLGRILLTRKDANAALASTTAAMDLIFTWYNPHTKVREDVRFIVKPASAAPYQLTTDDANYDVSDLFELTVMDARRADQLTSWDTSWNVNDWDLQNYQADTTNGGTTWGWSDILTALGIGNGGAFTPPDKTVYEPFNVVARNTPKSQVMDTAASQLQAVLTYDRGTAAYLMWVAGARSSANGTFYNNALHYMTDASSISMSLISTSAAWTIPSRHDLPKNIIVEFPCLTEFDDGQHQSTTYTKSVMVETLNDGPDRTVHFDSLVVWQRADSSGDVDYVNQDQADAVAAYVAAAAYKRIILPVATYELAGWHNVENDGLLRGIRWQLDPEGLHTFVQVNNDDDFSRLSRMERAVELASTARTAAGGKLLAGAGVDKRKWFFDNPEIVDWYPGYLVCSPTVDERYNVDLCMISSGNAASEQITFGSMPCTAGGCYCVTASDLDQVVAGTHNNTQTNGTAVIVYKMADRSNPPVYHWGFVRPLGGSGSINTTRCCTTTIYKDGYNRLNVCVDEDTIITDGSTAPATLRATGTQHRYQLISAYDKSDDPWCGWGDADNLTSCNWPAYAHVSILDRNGTCLRNEYIIFHSSDGTIDDPCTLPTGATGPLLTYGDGACIGFFVQFPQASEYPVHSSAGSLTAAGADLTSQRYLPWALKVGGDGVCWLDGTTCYQGGTGDGVKSIDMLTGMCLSAGALHFFYRTVLLDKYGRVIMLSDPGSDYVVCSCALGGFTVTGGGTHTP